MPSLRTACTAFAGLVSMPLVYATEVESAKHCSAQEEEDDAQPVMLLQHSHQKQRHAPTALTDSIRQPSSVVLNGSTAEERLESFKPIVWVHVPKTGSSFLNVFLLHSEICPLLPPAVESEGIDVACPAAFSPTYHTDRFFNHHDAIGNVYDAIAGHGVIILRQPEQRLISGYLHTAGAFPHGWPHQAPPQDAREYAEVMSGCVVKMLMREGMAVGSGPNVCSGPAVTDEETALAVVRLREGFPFVGFTERWRLSVCLFHAMFGGECHPKELMNTRLGQNRSSSSAEYAVDEYGLGDFRDVADRAVFTEAEEIFERNLATFGVTEDSCDAMCHR